MEQKKIKIEIKNRFTGDVLFDYEKENNTIKETLVEAVKNGADLRGANLHGADLHGADLQGANLHGADLHGAYLQGAYLQGAYLHGADLQGAYLHGAYLSDAKNIPFIPIACPSDGAFVGWKKVRTPYMGEYLVKLLIPEDAKRCSAARSKCRCDYAHVLSIYEISNGYKEVDEVTNESYAPLTYKVGENVYPDSFDEDRWNECSHGIHFFIDRGEAERY